MGCSPISQFPVQVSLFSGYESRSKSVPGNETFSETHSNKLCSTQLEGGYSLYGCI